MLTKIPSHVQWSSWYGHYPYYRKKSNDKITQLVPVADDITFGIIPIDDETKLKCCLRRNFTDEKQLGDPISFAGGKTRHEHYQAVVLPKELKTQIIVFSVNQTGFGVLETTFEFKDYGEDLSITSTEHGGDSILSDAFREGCGVLCDAHSNFIFAGGSAPTVISFDESGKPYGRSSDDKKNFKVLKKTDKEWQAVKQDGDIKPVVASSVQMINDHDDKGNFIWIMGLYGEFKMWKATENAKCDGKYKVEFVTTLSTEDINDTDIYRLHLDRLFLGSSPGKMIAILKFECPHLPIEHVMHIDMVKQKFVDLETPPSVRHDATAYCVKVHGPFHQQWQIEGENRSIMYNFSVCQWTQRRQLWIGYYKNQNNDRCHLSKLPKAVIKYLLSFTGSDGDCCGVFGY